MARVLCRVALPFLRAPPTPEVTLGLWLQICLGLARKQPARKVLSNALWFRLARVSPPNSEVRFAILTSVVGRQHLRPIGIKNADAAQEAIVPPNDLATQSRPTPRTWLR